VMLVCGIRTDRHRPPPERERHTGHTRRLSRSLLEAAHYGYGGVGSDGTALQEP
jgi:hypothetical protein